MKTYHGYKNKFITFIKLILIMFLISSCSTKNKIQVNCNLKNSANYSTEVVYLIEGNVVHEVSDPDNRVGQVEQKENEFFLHFPKTAQSFENAVRINRSTGAIEYEYGSPPFFSSNKYNVYFKGNCKIKKAE